jgi:hypothetical protein
MTASSGRGRDVSFAKSGFRLLPLRDAADTLALHTSFSSGSERFAGRRILNVSSATIVHETVNQLVLSSTWYIS